MVLLKPGFFPGFATRLYTLLRSQMSVEMVAMGSVCLSLAGTNRLGVSNTY